MKKLYLSSVFTIIFYFSFAQSYTAPGNKWHYNFCSCFSFPYPNSPVPLEIGATQIINGKLCSEVLSSGGIIYFVYESNDSVYYFVNALNGFSILYNFNATIGDSLKIYADESNGLDSIYMRIDSIGTITINGLIKKQIYWSELQNTTSSHLDFGYGPYNSYIEDIGSTFYFVPLSGLLDGIGGLRCFQDSTNVLYKANWAPSCDSVFYLSSDDLEAKNEIQIVPNPFENKISIRGIFSPKCKISIINSLGEKIYFSNIEGNEIDLGFLNKGIYFLSLVEGKNYKVKKIAKF